jgi:hypothetical protein
MYFPEQGQNGNAANLPSRTFLGSSCRTNETGKVSGEEGIDDY